MQKGGCTGQALQVFVVDPGALLLPGNELVEVDGFTFVRKRKVAVLELPLEGGPLSGQQITAAADAQQQQQQLQVVGVSLDLSPAEATQPSPLALAGAAPEDAPDRSPYLHSLLAPRPSGPTPPAQSAQEYSRSLLALLPPGCPGVLKVQWMVEQVMLYEAGRLDQQQQQQQQPGPTPAPGPRPSAAAVADPAPGPPAPGASRLTRLASAVALRFKELLQREVENAGVLLQQPNSAGGTVMYEDLPDMLKEATRGDVARCCLQQQLQALQQEEACWKSLEESYQAMDPPGPGPEQQQQPPAAGASLSHQQQAEEEAMSAPPKEAPPAAEALDTAAHDDVPGGSAGAAAALDATRQEVNDRVGLQVGGRMRWRQAAGDTHTHTMRGGVLEVCSK